MIICQALEAIRHAWCDETSAPAGFLGGSTPHGQCAVTALLVQDWFGGELLRAEVPGLGSHYWNLIPGMGDIDLTRSQYHSNVEIPRGEIVPRSRLLEGERAERAQTELRYRILKGRAETTLLALVTGVQP